MLTEAERQELRRLSTSWAELGRLLNANPETLKTIAGPHGFASSATITKIRARLAEFRSAHR